MNKTQPTFPRPVLRGLVLALLMSAILSSSIWSKESYNYSLAVGFTPQTLSGGDSALGGSTPKFTLSPGFSVSLGRRLGTLTRVRLDFLSATIYSDATATSNFQFGSKEASRVAGFKSRRVSVALAFLPLKDNYTITPILGLGIGVDMWKFIDPVSDTTLDTLNDKSLPQKFEAQELTLTSFVGLEIDIGSKLALALETRADYLAGPGSEFADITNSSRPRWAYSASARLQYSFGITTERERWTSDRQWQQTKPSKRREPGASSRDSDGDGVEDDRDKCPSTAAGATVNSLGCPMDSDGDGIFDGLDDCPDTPAGALGAVDIYGCPIDSDFDGVQDFIDACPSSAIGAHVDEQGCPLDSDSDGIADGLDDCPNTSAGLKVDERGCLDVSLFAKPMILNISYESGSFEVDSKTKGELQTLSLMLKAAASIQLEIIGYTDNIGSSDANRALSEKRARRVRDYLKSIGISAKRMKVKGRGETNFIAANSTAQGRQKNRRIEILFRKN